jgi:hypothetical protein
VAGWRGRVQTIDPQTKALAAPSQPKGLSEEQLQENERVGEEKAQRISEAVTTHHPPKVKRWLVNL